MISNLRDVTVFKIAVRIANIYNYPVAANVGMYGINQPLHKDIIKKLGDISKKCEELSSEQFKKTLDKAIEDEMTSLNTSINRLVQKQNEWLKNSKEIESIIQKFASAIKELPSSISRYVKAFYEGAEPEIIKGDPRAEYLNIMNSPNVKSAIEEYKNRRDEFLKLREVMNIPFNVQVKINELNDILLLSDISTKDSDLLRRGMPGGKTSPGGQQAPGPGATKPGRKLPPAVGS